MLFWRRRGFKRAGHRQSCLRGSLQFWSSVLPPEMRLSKTAKKSTSRPYSAWKALQKMSLYSSAMRPRSPPQPQLPTEMYIASLFSFDVTWKRWAGVTTLSVRMMDELRPLCCDGKICLLGAGWKRDDPQGCLSDSTGVHTQLVHEHSVPALNAWLKTLSSSGPVTSNMHVLNTWSADQDSQSNKDSLRETLKDVFQDLVRVCDLPLTTGKRTQCWSHPWIIKV